MSVGTVISEVLTERTKQNEKWGEQNHDPIWWLGILVEEVGEFAKAILHTRFGGPEGGVDNLREEAIHTAAVAIQFVEYLDRNQGGQDD